jgi:hypothetical protein
MTVEEITQQIRAFPTSPTGLSSTALKDMAEAICIEAGKLIERFLRLASSALRG